MVKVNSSGPLYSIRAMSKYTVLRVLRSMLYALCMELVFN